MTGLYIFINKAYMGECIQVKKIDGIVKEYSMFRLCPYYLLAYLHYVLQ